MPTEQASRSAETEAVAQFLRSSGTQPSALVVEGDAGIGKTTLWLSAVEQGRQRGMRVLSARAAAAESVMAYAALADLLAEVDPAVLSGLPDPQRLAVDRILLRASDDGVTDQRAVAAAFLSVVASLAERSPVLVALDDMQWLDPSSAKVIGFAARRVTGPVGVLGTVRTGGPSDDTQPWLQLHRPDALHRIRLQPLSIGGLHAVLATRLGRSLSRRAIVAIHEESGGNPFYGLELAQAMAAAPAGRTVPLPHTLAEIVRAKLNKLDTSVRPVLLAMACLAAPTVEVVSQAVAVDADDLVDRLADAETNGIIAIDGHRLRFSHPLLVSGVYTDATPAQRRTMHRCLAPLVDQPELRARHLALAATRPDPATLQALDDAAHIARQRGAPAAAAELMDLAMGLGGDTPERRIRCAAAHLDAGDPMQARTILQQTIRRLTPGRPRAQALNMLAVVSMVNDDFAEAAGLLERALADAGDDLELRSTILVTLSYALFNCDRLDAAMSWAENAVADASRVDRPTVLGQALGMRAMLRFLRGDGLDEVSLTQAIRLESDDADIPIAFRPTTQRFLLLDWTGHLDEAHEGTLSLRRRCEEHGDEAGLTFVDFNAVLNCIWRGRFADAASIAEQSVERALQLGGEVPLAAALTGRATVGAYTGDESQARSDIAAAMAAWERCNSYRLREWVYTALGFLELSLGNHAAAVDALEPLLSRLDAAMNATEIIQAAFMPDAAEALITLGRNADAEPFISALERNGRRLDRPWMLAVGARCRAMLLGANGDLDTASVVAQQALAAHDRLPMPFERARTQLLLGQLQRRRRQREAATTTLREALAVFENLNTPLWAARARSSLGRNTTGPSTAGVLTASERRVAELVASGLTNNDVGAALYISPKTVEVHLSRIYRKLDIRSRAELGRRIDQLDS